MLGSEARKPQRQPTGAPPLHIEIAIALGVFLAAVLIGIVRGLG